MKGFHKSCILSITQGYALKMDVTQCVSCLTSVHNKHLNYLRCMRANMHVTITKYLDGPYFDPA